MTAFYNWIKLRDYFASFVFGLVFTVCSLDGKAATTNSYHMNRTFTPVAYTAGVSTVYSLMVGLSNITGIVKSGTNVNFDTNASYAVEYESLALGYASPDVAWQAVSTNFLSNARTHEGQTYDNTGWVKGTHPAYGTWGGYLWFLENHATFKTSPTNFWVSPAGVTNLIEQVMVGTVGDYLPMTNAVDVGPTNWANITNYLGSGGASDVVCKADFNTYYKLLAPRVELITPSGDPANAPVDSGDGQNEFTFSTNSSGVLEMNLKARVSPSGMASQIVSRCHFTIDTIGTSSMAWDSSNPNGVPIVSNDFFVAKVTFTGLPTSNSAFGLKKVAVYYYGQKKDEKSLEVFFSKWAANHPGGQPGNPNWFYYWKDGGVCGIGANCVFTNLSNTWGYTMPSVDSIIRLCDLAPEANSGPETYASSRANEGYGSPPDGTIIVTGQGKGIKGVAETIQHESEHIYIYNTYGSQADNDGDGIPNTSETTNTSTSYGGVASDFNTSDTYHMAYGTYSDQELRCRKKELTLTINIYTNLDWANPGCQSKNMFGP